jgi:hypothetical protein
MSPISSPDPCPRLRQVESFYFCDDYENRPDECAKHDFPAKVCPIGYEKLGIKNIAELRLRIDTGYAIVKFRCSSAKEALKLLYK